MLTKEEKRKKNAERAKAWQKANPEKARTTKLKRAFGITHEDYLDLKGSDGCFICGRECPSGRHLAVDHDHGNGVIRGLLCINCNKGLGNFKEDINLMGKAIDYLKRYRQLLKEHGRAAA